MRWKFEVGDIVSYDTRTAIVLARCQAGSAKARAWMHESEDPDGRCYLVTAVHEFGIVNDIADEFELELRQKSTEVDFKVGDKVVVNDFGAANPKWKRLAGMVGVVVRAIWSEQIQVEIDGECLILPSWFCSQVVSQ